MKKIATYFLFFIIGLLVGITLLQKNKKEYRTEQVELIQNGIKNVSKLVVAEESFTQFYKYSDSDKYLFETLQFDKKIILIVTAKVFVSYDLKKMKIDLDSVNKKILIKYIPKEELTLVPSYKYYDFQQSMFNSFTKEELNTVQKSSTEKLTKSLEVSKSKEIAKKRLMEELNQIWTLAIILGWVIEDQTENQVIKDILPRELLQKEVFK